MRTHSALESARDFSASAAHELRTPLTAMRTDLDILRTHPLSQQQREEVLADLARTQLRVAGIITALGQLASGELSDPKDRIRFNLMEILDRVALDSSRLNKNVKILVNEGPSMEIEGWPDGLRIALDNIIRNAITHGQATEVIVAVDPPKPGQNLISVIIDDNGRGLPESECELVLTRFHRGSTAQPGGLGLGLALVMQQATLHGGSFSLKPNPVRGIRAVLTLHETTTELERN
ncbi:MAG: sensor histidine kinase [Mycobacteriaceae bacterium]